MNKKILAASILVAMSSSSFADVSAVDIYGTVNMSYDLIKTNTTVSGEDENLNRISSNFSYIGFKGKEVLDQDLSIIWQVEQGINIDGGNGAFGGDSLRNTFLGVSSKKMGTVLAGKHDTPYLLATEELDPFADGMGDYNSIIGTASTLSSVNVFNARTNNTLMYMSPTFDGFSFNGGYSFQNENGNGSVQNNKEYSLAGMYNNGPIFGSLSYGKKVVGVDEAQSWKLGAGYTFATQTKVGVVYEKMSANGAPSEYDHNTWYVSASHPINAFTIKGALGRAGNNDVASSTSAMFVALGTDYSLSKRTSLYAVYTHVKNNSGAGYGLGDSAYVPGSVGCTGTCGNLGDDPTAISLGMKHSF